MALRDFVRHVYRPLQPGQGNQRYLLPFMADTKENDKRANGVSLKHKALMRQFTFSVSSHRTAVDIYQSTVFPSSERVRFVSDRSDLLILFPKGLNELVVFQNSLARQRMLSPVYK